MSTLIQPLGDFAHSIYQGASITRYRSPKGTAQRIVNIGNLQKLRTQGPLEEERLSYGSYLGNALQTHDLAIATRGTILKASVVAGEHAGAVAGQNLAVLRPQRELIHPVYLAGVLRSSHLQAAFERLSMRSTTIKLITLKELGELPIPCPPLSEQQTLAKLFLEIETLDNLALESVRARRQLREAAIGSLFGGQ